MAFSLVLSSKGAKLVISGRSKKDLDKVAKKFGVDQDLVEKLFKLIMKNSRDIQRKI